MYILFNKPNFDVNNCCNYSYSFCLNIDKEPGLWWDKPREEASLINKLLGCHRIWHIIALIACTWKQIMDWVKQFLLSVTAMFFLKTKIVFRRQTTKGHQSLLYWQGIHCCQRCFWLDSLPPSHWQYVDFGESFSFSYLNLNQWQCSILWRLCEYGYNDHAHVMTYVFNVRGDLKEKINQTVTV